MIDSNTQLYAVFGHPVRHSKSPFLHNFLFRQHELNAVYLAFEIHDIGSAVQTIRDLNIQGVSITIPHKETVMEHLDWIDPIARQVGAVNTIVNSSGTLKGYNTDIDGAMAPLLMHGIKHKKVCVLGAGGAAQAIACGIRNQGADLYVVNRSREKGEKLAQTFNGMFIESLELKQINPDIIVNTTPVGMFPHTTESPVSEDVFKPGMIAMDIVYNPLKTRFLTLAEQNRCHIIDGLNMFIRQGIAQFKLWTDRSCDYDQVRQHFSE